MNSKRSLMTVLVGLAMLATPIAAAAHDYHYHHATHGPGLCPPLIVREHVSATARSSGTRATKSAESPTPRSMATTATAAATALPHTPPRRKSPPLCGPRLCGA